MKAQLTAKAIEDLPELQEDELRDFYAAVMESGKSQGADKPLIEAPGRRAAKVLALDTEEKRMIVEGLAQRLLSPSDQAGPSSIIACNDAGHEAVRKIIAKLEGLVEDHESGSSSKVPLGLVGPKEWGILLEEMGRFGSACEAERVLNLMSVSCQRTPCRDDNSDLKDSWYASLRGANGADHGIVRKRRASDPRRNAPRQHEARSVDL